MALSFNADFFHRPEFDLCPCVSIYAHAFSLFLVFLAASRFRVTATKSQTSFNKRSQPCLALASSLWSFDFTKSKCLYTPASSSSMPKRIIIWLSAIRAIRRKPRRGRHFVAQLWKSLSQKKGYCRNGHECLPNAKTVYIITKCEPKSKRIILILFQLNNMSPTKWGLLRSLFCMTKKTCSLQKYSWFL